MKLFDIARASAARQNSREQTGLEGAIDNQWGPVIRGWAKIGDGSQPALVLIRADGEVYYKEASEIREDLKERRVHPTGGCGFSVNVGRRLLAPVEVSVFSPAGLLVQSRPDFVGKPIFFMHIAKTAGSSVNEFFINHFGRARAAMHIEAVSDPSTLAHHQFISGHISLQRFERDYDTARFYTATVLRDPVHQLASHLNWVRHLSEPERADFLKGHPPIVQEISARLREVDFADPSAMRDFAQALRPAERSLFDNCQCRYFHTIPPGRAYDEEAFARACESLARFDFVGLTENFEPAMRFLGAKAGIIKPWERAPRVNVNKFSYGFDVSNPELVAAIEPLIRYDQALYHRAAEISDNLLKAVSTVL